MRERYDVVVIGSGFGGAITACRLAQAGRSVAILEKGRQWEKTEFPRSPGEVSGAFWREKQSHGFLEYKVFKRIDVVQGCGVGGGSLHYFNVHLRTPASIFDQPAWPARIKRPLLDPYYALAEQMLESEPLTPPAGRELPARTQAFLDAANATGRKGELVPIGVYTGPNRRNPASGIEQSPCDYSGNCLIGCAQHAKNSLDLNYIPLARKNGAEVYPLHAVDGIAPHADGGYRVDFRRLDADDPARSEPGSVHGTQVVVAGGTLGTNELLLRCRDMRKTLPNLSPALGQRFSGNGDFILALTANANRAIDPSRGPSITAAADFSTENNRIFIEDVGFPEPFVWMLEGTIPASNRFRELLGSMKTYVLDALGIGNGRIAFEADRLFRGGATTHMLPYLGMGTDAADGRVKLKAGSVDVAWNPRASKPMFREMEAALRHLSRELGGKYVTSLLWKWPLRKLLTAHPLGGCCMGGSSQTSVVNENGEAWGYPGLYVADAAAIPSALAVNPSLTISALAERVAFQMIHQREMEAGDSHAPPNG